MEGNIALNENEEERRRELSRKRRREIDEARRVNNSEHHNQLHKSMCDEYSLQKSFRDDLNVFMENERKKKEEREKYLREGMKL